MIKILFTFPGQSGQHPGMLAAILDHEAISTQACVILGGEVATLDSTDTLQHTRAVRLCLLIAGVAWAHGLQRRGADPQMVSSPSIGASPVTVIAGALDFASTLRLATLRGDLVEQAYPKGYRLTAIMGLTRPRVEALMQSHEVYLTNFNAETQIVTAECGEAIAGMAQLALRAGVSKVQQLAVNISSHCALLDKPAAVLAKAFADVTSTYSQRACLNGLTAHVLWSPQRIADDLTMNMARTVRQQEAMIATDEHDAGLAIEMPPGGVLTCLTRQAGWRGETISPEHGNVDVVRHLTQRLND